LSRLADLQAIQAPLKARKAASVGISPARFVEILGPYRLHALRVLLLLGSSAIVDMLSIGSVIPFLQIIVADGAAPGASLAGEGALGRLARALQGLSEEQRLWVVGGGMLLVFAVRGVLVILRNFSASKFTNTMRMYWTRRIFENFVYADLLDLKKQKQGVFINNLITEPTYAAKGIHDAVDIAVGTMVSLSIVSLLLVVNWKVTLVVAAVVALGVGGVWRISSLFAENVGKTRIQRNQQINQLVTETVNGIRQIKVFSAERRVLEELRERLRSLMFSLDRFALFSALPTAAGEVIVVFIMVGSLFLGKFVFDRDLATLLPEIGVFSVAFLKLFAAASLALSKRMSLATYWPSIVVVHELANASPEDARQDRQEAAREAESPQQAAVARVRGELSARGLTFSFPGGADVLRGVDFDLPAGQIIGLAGRSGSGKSTICDLSAKLLSPTSGELRVDGKPLSEWNTPRWRKRIGYVSQEPFLFHASVLENILIGKPDGSREDALRAARLADADGFISSLPEGYDTVIGAGGVGLSGGQSQRIAIARALARDPDLLIMDEATSGLDFESESRIFRMLKSERESGGRRTVLIITHRLRTLEFADRILYLEQGQVTENGSFPELMSAGGGFRKLVDLDRQ
jgi:subfamily B ATP-binding cassette protein MsbA